MGRHRGGSTAQVSVMLWLCAVGCTSDPHERDANTDANPPAGYPGMSTGVRLTEASPSVLASDTNLKTHSGEATPTLPPSPDVEALFDALEAGDQDAVATHAAISLAYHDAGGPSISESRVAGTPDVESAATALSDPDPEVRRDGMDELAFNTPYLGGEAAAELIRRGLSDSNEAVRREATHAALAAAVYYRTLSRLDQPTTWNWGADVGLRTGLIRALGESDPGLVSDAVMAVSYLYEPASDIRTALVDAYDSGADPSRKASIVGGLAMHAYDGAEVNEILAAARADADPDVRHEAVLATALCQVPYAADILREMLETEADQDTRSAIRGALHMLGRASPAP